MSMNVTHRSGVNATVPNIANRPETNIPFRLGGDENELWADVCDKFLSNLRHNESSDNTPADVGPQPPDTFTSDWYSQNWAELLSRAEAFDWSSQTALLGFTASSRLSGAKMMLPPAHHYNLLTESRGAVNKALSRALDDVDMWRSITSIGCHESGYLFFLTGIWLSDQVDISELKPVLSAHVNNCPLASEDAHQNAISIKSTQSEMGALGPLLGNSVPGMDRRDGRQGWLLTSPRSEQLGASIISDVGANPLRY